jgi:hypothetical protein
MEAKTYEEVYQVVNAFKNELPFPEGNGNS